MPEILKKEMTNTGYDSLGAVVGLTDEDLQEIEKERCNCVGRPQKSIKNYGGRVKWSSLGKPEQNPPFSQNTRNAKPRSKNIKRKDL
jgi:hypothetical protein